MRLTGERVDEYMRPFLGDGISDLIHRGEHRGNLRAAILGHDGKLFRVVAEANVVVLLQHRGEARAKLAGSSTHRDGDESRPGLRREDTLGLVDQKVDQALVMPADLAVARVGRPDDALK